MKPLHLFLIALPFLFISCNQKKDVPNEKVDLVSVFVQSKINLNTMDEAWVSLNVRLLNRTGQAVKGKLKVKFEGKDFSETVKLEAQEAKDVKLTVDDAPELYVESPRIWWCNGLGKPELYSMELIVEADGELSDSRQVSFAIRETRECMECNSPSCCVLNGTNVQLKGVAWTDGIVPRGHGQDNRTRMRYLDGMNLNTVWLDKAGIACEEILHLCDEYGLLALPMQPGLVCDTVATRPDTLSVENLFDYQNTKNMFEAIRMKNFPDTLLLHTSLAAVPAEAYYAAKKANIGRQLVYNHVDNAIYFVSDIVRPVELNARVAFYGMDSKVLQTAFFPFRVEADYVKKIFDLDSIAGDQFLSLQLQTRDGKPIADNFYCMASAGALKDIPQASLSVKAPFFYEGEEVVVSVEATNNSPAISLMTRFRLKDVAGNIVGPAFWDDNYISIFPGETRTVQCSLHREQVADKGVRLYVSGLNLEEGEVLINW